MSLWVVIFLFQTQLSVAAPSIGFTQNKNQANGCYPPDPTTALGPGVIRFQNIATNTNGTFLPLPSCNEAGKKMLQQYTDAKSSCDTLQKEWDLYYQHCAHPRWLNAPEAKRVYLQLLFSQELMYLSRLPTTTPGFNKLWADFKSKWQKRLNSEENKELLKDDNDPKHPDRCKFNWLAGKTCNGKRLDTYSETKANAPRENLSERLLQIQLETSSLLFATQSNEGTVIAAIKHLTRESRLHSFPEFVFEPKIGKTLQEILKSREYQAGDLLEKFFPKDKAKTKTKNLLETIPMSDLISEESQKTLKSILSKKPLSHKEQKQIETVFLNTYQKMIQNIDDEYNTTIKHPQQSRAHPMVASLLYNKAVQENDLQKQAYYLGISCHEKSRAQKNAETLNWILTNGTKEESYSTLGYLLLSGTKYTAKLAPPVAMYSLLSVIKTYGLAYYGTSEIKKDVTIHFVLSNEDNKAATSNDVIVSRKNNKGVMIGGAISILTTGALAGKALSPDGKIGKTANHIFSFTLAGDAGYQIFSEDGNISNAAADVVMLGLSNSKIFKFFKKKNKPLPLK